MDVRNFTRKYFITFVCCKEVLMVKQIGLWHYIKVLSIFLMLTHLLIIQSGTNSFTAPTTVFFHIKETSHKECDKVILKENNTTPVKCNGNYCSGFSSLFTAPFSSFTFGRFEKDVKNRFFLYDDPSYSSFFNSIWIPPKITA